MAARVGGPAYALFGLAQAQLQAGLSLCVLATDQAGPAQLGRTAATLPLVLPENADGVEARLCETGRAARLAYSPSLAASLRHAAATADVVHIHGLFLYPTLAAFRASTKASIPFVISPHGSLDPWIRRQGRARKAVMHVAWQRAAFKHAAVLHATTAVEARNWPRYARDDRVHVVPNGLDLASFASITGGERFRSRFGIPAQAPLVLNVGRLSRKKNLDILISAVAHVRMRGIDAHLALVGPDDEGLGKRLTGLASDLHVSEAVHVVGVLDGAEKRQAYAAASAFSLPSSTENFGIAVLEALASGVPVHVSSGVALSAELRAAGAAEVTEADATATAHALTSLLTNRDVASEKAVLGRAFAERYDWAGIAAQWVEIYENIVR